MKKKAIILGVLLLLLGIGCTVLFLLLPNIQTQEQGNQVSVSSQNRVENINSVTNSNVMPMEVTVNTSNAPQVTITNDDISAPPDAAREDNSNTASGSGTSSSLLSTLPIEDVPYAEEFFIQTERGRYVNEEMTLRLAGEFAEELFRDDDSNEHFAKLAEYAKENASTDKTKLGEILRRENKLPVRYTTPQARNPRLLSGYANFPDSIVQATVDVGDMEGQSSSSCIITFNVSMKVIDVEIG